MAATGPALTGDSGNFRFGVDNIQAIVRGDWNRDGSVTSADLQVMLNALTDLNAYKTTNSVDAKTLLAIGDFSGDGSVTNADIQPMLNLLASAGAGSFAAVPEPSAILLGLVAAAGFWMRRRPVAA